PPSCVLVLHDSLPIYSAALPGVPMPYVPEREFLRSFRTSLNILGDGYVEAIADETLEQVARSQSFVGNRLDVAIAKNIERRAEAERKSTPLNCIPGRK